MAYVTGQAANIDQLRTAIFNACTANGWALNSEVLSKGGVFVEITIQESLDVPPAFPPRLLFLGGLGIDGNDDLTTPGLSSALIGELDPQEITYPVTYEVHINTSPDEVYVVVNYSVDFYQWAAWGQSDVAGLPGAGAWYAASKAHATNAPIKPPDTNESGAELPYLFGWNNPPSTSNSFVHHGLDGAGWNDDTGLQPNAWKPAVPLQMIQPNLWNAEPVLVPIQVWVPRTEGDKVSLVADLRHARYTRIDNHDPGDVITLGPDSWKIYPWYRKDVSNRDILTSTGEPHTGTLAWAVRYTGP